MADAVTIHIEGMEKLQAKFAQLSAEIEQTNGAAGKEAANLILDTEGVRRYPPMTAANRLPYPYYQRNSGTQTSANHNMGNSEHYGQSWTVESYGYTTTIGNSASYGPYLGGNPPAKAMARIGWRSLYAVAMEKISQITAIYQGWFNRLISRISSR